MESWIHRYINPIEPGLHGSSMKIDFMIFHEVLKISSEDENNYTSVHNTFVFIHPGPVVAFSLQFLLRLLQKKTVPVLVQGSPSVKSHGPNCTKPIHHGTAIGLPPPLTLQTSPM